MCLIGLRGRVVWGKDEHVQVPMASTTKILTAIILIEEADLSEVVTVEKKAAGMRAGLVWGLRRGIRLV